MRLKYILKEIRERVIFAIFCFVIMLVAYVSIGGTSHIITWLLLTIIGMFVSLPFVLSLKDKKE